MDKLKVSVDNARSSFDLNGNRMKMNLTINCNEYYRTHNGKEMTKEIFEAIERIMENYALVHNQPVKNK